MKTPFFFLLGALCSLAAVCNVGAQATVIAYEVPAETSGNQAFDGAIGMDFDVANPVIVTKLGCFDDSSDGMNRLIAVRLYDRDTLDVLASADFGPDDPGLPGDEQGTLVGGSRFKLLAAAVTLPVGFHGTIVAEGYGDGERLGNRGVSPLSLVFNTGASSLAMVGGGRYNFPVVAGAYPETVDGGPADRYAAGTFEFQTTAPLFPGTPDLTASGAHESAVLTWPAVTEPLPAAKYQVLKSDSPGGVFTQIAEVTVLTFTDTALTNGTRYCYQVRAIAAGGQVGPDSVPKCAYPYNLGANQRIAYHVPGNLVGNQNFGGTLGMDFDIDNPVVVKRLGVFDDGSDGLFLPLTARIYDRDTQEVVAEMVFDPDDPGTPEREDGEPVEGMRFKALAAPLTLPAGFKGVIAGSGYGLMEFVRNSHGDVAAVSWSLDDGDGSVRFVGTSRFGDDPAGFPATGDAGPAARYAAGTFQYETTAPLLPGTPVISLSPAVENHAATLVWSAVLLPLPAAKYKVLRASDAAGPFAEIGETTSTTFRDSALPNGVAVYYTVVAVSAGAQTSAPSNVVGTTPASAQGGIAYVVPEATFGNQNFGGSLGMHFDVLRPVWITRLGVFDSGSDGLLLTITAVLYNRQTQAPLATLVFAPGDEGELIGGSRFKDLPAPVLLPAGFQGTMAASGYGNEEMNGNAGAVDLGLTTFDGAVLLSFVGTSGFGSSADPTAFPSNADGGPANRYAAGTFAFEPELADPQLTIQVSGAGVQLDWTLPTGALERSAALLPGAWELVPGATTGIVLPRTGTEGFFRITQ